MAIEIEIPKDITKYESKLIGPLTTRQVVCLVPAVGLAIAVYNVLKPFLSQDMCMGAVIFSVIPFLLCGFYKPYGMPFEKFIKSIFISNFVAPKHRKYKTVNVYNEINNLDKSTTKSINKNKTNQKKKGKKDNGNIVSSKDCTPFK